jgi:segregation and condensation protein A
MHAKPQLELTIYSGPLDLLLSLIEQQRLDITAISLSQVADQYMRAVAALDAPDADALAEFLVIGAKLLVIKTRALLPRPPAELAPADDDDVGAQLARQLVAYKRFKEAAQQLRAWEQTGRRAYDRRAAPPLLLLPPPPTRLDVGLNDLVAAVQRRLQLLLPLDDAPQSLPAPKIITIADVRARIGAMLRSQNWTTFEDLLSLALSRNEVIVTLWTVLEMFKREAIVIEQQQVFGPIAIGRGPAFGTLDDPDEAYADDDES